MDEKVLEQIQFHTDTVEADENSPLHLIREKEMEISGHVLAAKKEAEEIVARARKDAAEVTGRAQGEGAQLATEQEVRILADVEKRVAEVGVENEQEIEELRGVIAGRMDKAVEYVVGVVTGA